MKRILYLSFTGVLEPLGFSQIVRPICALAERGIRYEVISLERTEDLADHEAVQRIEARLSAAGVTWTRLPYEAGRFGQNIARANAVALRRGLSGEVAMLHARGYMAASVGLTLWRTLRIPYLFDKRGFWIDEQRIAGRHFTREPVYQLAKRGERALYRHAAGVVSLTQLGAQDVFRGEFGPWATHKPVEVIPTLVDFDAFDLQGRGDPAAVPEPVEARLAGRLVVGFIGSANASYRVEESFALFAKLRARRPDAHLLCLTRQQAEIRQRLAAAGIAEADATVRSATHEDMPKWLSRVDWGLLLLNTNFAKRASMPTKLGEFFAAGVRPIHSGCNPEVGRWVLRAGTGCVVAPGEAGLEQAAETIGRARADPEALARARARTAAHFGLAAGVQRYANLISELAPAACA